MTDDRVTNRSQEQEPSWELRQFSLISTDRYSPAVMQIANEAGELYTKAAVQFLIECWNTNTLPDDTAIVWGDAAVMLPGQHPDGSPNWLVVQNVMVFEPESYDSSNPETRWLLPPLSPNVGLLRAATDRTIVTNEILFTRHNTPPISPTRWRTTLETTPLEGTPEAYEQKPKSIIEHAKHAGLRTVRLDRAPVKTLARYADAGLLPSSRDAKYIGDEEATSGMRRYPHDTVERLKAIDNFVRYTGRTLEQVSAMLRPAWRPASYKTAKRT